MIKFAIGNSFVRIVQIIIIFLFVVCILNLNDQERQPYANYDKNIDTHNDPKFSVYRYTVSLD